LEGRLFSFFGRYAKLSKINGPIAVRDQVKKAGVVGAESGKYAWGNTD
jgi:hypothetical protein